MKCIYSLVSYIEKKENIQYIGSEYNLKIVTDILLINYLHKTLDIVISSEDIQQDMCTYNNIKLMTKKFYSELDIVVSISNIIDSLFLVNNKIYDVSDIINNYSSEGIKLRNIV